MISSVTSKLLSCHGNPNCMEINEFVTLMLHRYCLTYWKCNFLMNLFVCKSLVGFSISLLVIISLKGRKLQFRSSIRALVDLPG